MFSTSKLFVSPVAAGYFIGVLRNPGRDLASTGIAYDSSGNIYVVGTNNAASNFYIELIKYDPSGVVVWQRQFGVSTLATPNISSGVSVDSSNNVYVSGSSYNSGLSYETLLIKLDSSGTITWQKTLNYADLPDYGTGVTVDSSLNVYLCGQSEIPGAPAWLVAKYGSTGTVTWQRRAYYFGNEQPNSIAVDSSGDVHAAGYSIDSSSFKSADLFKWTSAGVLSWKKKLTGASNDDEFKGVAVDSSSNVYVCGRSQDGANNKIILAKYNNAGTVLWQRQLTTIGVETIGKSIALDSAANVYICGDSAASGINRMQIAKYDTNGVFQWQMSLGGPVGSTGQGIQIDSSNTMYVCGSTFAGGSNEEFLFAKLPSDGSMAGTYVVGGYTFTYSASSLTSAVGSLTAANSGLTSATTTLAQTNGTVVNSVTTLDSYVTPV